jgi:hypothetical protein
MLALEVNGAGDATAALFLAHLLRDSTLAEALLTTASTGSGSYTGSGPFRFRSEIYYDPRYNTPLPYASTGSTFCGRVPILGPLNHYFSARIRVGLCRMLDTNFGELTFRNCLKSLASLKTNA